MVGLPHAEEEQLHYLLPVDLELVLLRRSWTLHLVHLCPVHWSNINLRLSCQSNTRFIKEKLESLRNKHFPD